MARLRRPVPLAVRGVLADESAAARRLGPSPEGWRAAERAHVLSQPWPLAHVRAHALMLGLAVRGRDRVEVVGQVVRLVLAGPGSAVGRYPAGNTGRARVGLTTPMPLPVDLAALLRQAGVEFREPPPAPVG